MVSPSLGDALLTVLVVTKSELVTVIISVKSFPIFERSVSLPVAAVAVFVMVFPPWFASTVTLIVNTAELPFAILPIFQTPPI